jgi:trafficking protein particle complex subunit 4
MSILLQLFIINRSGGLVYNRNLSDDAPELKINDWLRLGSTFHGLHQISSEIAPVPSSGIKRIQTDIFHLECLQTLTGVKFVITARPRGSPDLSKLLQSIYRGYCDFVLKNPFYEIDMPIRCELFNKHLDSILA